MHCIAYLFATPNDYLLFGFFAQQRAGVARKQHADKSRLVHLSLTEQFEYAADRNEANGKVAILSGLNTQQIDVKQMAKSSS